MAESGSIYAKLLLDESAFITSLKSALNNANDTFGKIIGPGDKTTQAFDKTQKSISGMGRENTLAGLNERLQRLNGILDKTQIGSQRFQQIQKEIDVTKTKIDEAGNRFGAFGKLFDTLGKVGINIPVTGIAAAGAAFTKVISIAGEYEKQVTELGAASGATGAQFDQLKGKARELGASTSFSAKEAAQGMTELAKAGMDSNQVLGATEHVLNLAKAGSLGLAEASTIAADTMASFGLKTDDAAQSAVNMQRISDNLAKAANASTISVQEVGETFKYVAGVSNSLGVSLEKTSAMTALLGNEGIKASSAGTALKAILLNLSAPTSSGVGALAQIGLSQKDFKDAKGNLKDVSDIFEILNKKTAGMGNTQKASIFKDLFGTESVTAAVAIVNKSEKSIKDSSGKMISELDQLEKTMVDANKEGFAKKYGDQLSDNFQGAVKSLQSAVEEIVLLVGDLVLPIVRPLAEVANVIVNVLGGAIRFLIRPFQLLFQILNEFVSKSVQGFALLAGAAFVFKGALLSLVPAITAALAPLAGFLAANAAIIAVVIAVATLIAYQDELKAAFAEVWKSMTDTVDDLMIAIADIITPVVEFFSTWEEGAGIFDTIVGYLFDIAEGARQVWKWFSESKILVGAMKLLFAPIVIFINLISIGIAVFASALKIVAGIASDLKEKFLSIKDSLGINFDPVKQKAAEFWNYIKSVFDFSGLAKTAGSVFTGMFSGLNIGDAISKMFSGINLSGLFASLNNAGQKVINDFLGYLKREFPKTFQMFSWLANSISETLTYIVNRVKAFFTDMMDSMKRGWENIKKYFSSESEQVPGSDNKPKTDKPKPAAPVFAPPGSGSAGNKQKPLESLNDLFDRAKKLDDLSKGGIEFNVSIPMEKFEREYAVIQQYAKENNMEIKPEFKFDSETQKQEVDLNFKLPDGKIAKTKGDLLTFLSMQDAKVKDSNSLKVPVEPQVKMESLNQLHGTMIKVNEDFEKIGKSSGLEKLARGIQLASDSLQQLGAGFTEMLSATAKLASVKFDNFKQNLSFLSQGMTKLIDDGLKNTINKINEETNLRVKGFDDQMAVLKAQKEAELALEEQFQTDMKLLKAQMDADSKAENDRLFEEQWAKRQADYDNQRALIEAGTADATEKQISEQALLSQAEEEKIALRQQFDQRLVDQVANNQTAIDAKTAEHQAQKDAKDKERDDKEKAINDAKTAFLAEQENKRTQAQDQAEQKKNEIKRNSALLEWAMGRSAFEANKRAQSSAIQIGMAQAVMNAIVAMSAMTAATLGFGFPIALAIAGTITAMALAAGATSLAAVNAQQYPPPPIMAEGGLIGGLPHSAGGTMVNAERGEFIVNAADTARNIDTLQAINSGSFSQNSGQTVNVYIGDTKIFSGQNMSADAIARVASDRIRQDIYQAVSR